LLLTSDGRKMGKTQAGAVWLDPEKTSPYDFYQYWRNVDDADVLRCLRMLTFLPLEQIDAMDKWEGSQLNRAKEILAYELTEMVHGTAAADKAQETAKGLFVGGGNLENMPQTILSESHFQNGSISVVDLLLQCGLSPSKGEARRLITQGGVSVNGGKADVADFFTKEQAKEGLMIKKGKKVFHRATLE
jgi:tyrosyl-tRNA synthetase